MFFGITALCLVGLTWLIFGIIMGCAPKKNIAVEPLLFLSSLFALLVSIAIGCIQGGIPAEKAEFMIMLILFGSGLANTLQLIFMSKAMQKGPNGIIWSMTQSGFIIPFLSGVLFFHAKSSIVCWIGFFSVIIALFLIGIGKEETQKKYHDWQIPAFFAFAITGISQALSNIPSYFPETAHLSSVWKAAAVALGMTLGPVLFSPFDKGMKTWFLDLRKSIGLGRVWLYCIYLEAFDILGSYFLLYPGMDRLAKEGIGAISYPLMVGSCIIGFEVYSIIFLKERRTLLQYLALLLCMAGVVSLAF